MGVFLVVVVEVGPRGMVVGEACMYIMLRGRKM